MSSSESLVARIRAEYREMPGLVLTFAQACRLWQLEPGECDRVLNVLLREHFLQFTADGRICSAADTSSTAHAAPAKVTLRRNKDSVARQRA